MAEIKSQAPNIGQIQISDDVLAIIAGTAALEVDGVVSPPNRSVGDFASILGKKNMSKGIKISVDDGFVTAELNIIVKFGCIIQIVSSEIQKRVKTAIETMTGMEVTDVNVNVTGIQVEREVHARPEK